MDGGGFQRVFFGKIEEAAGELDFVHFTDRQVIVAHHRTANFKTIDRFFQDHLIIISESEGNRIGKLVLRLDSGNSVGGTGFHRLHKQRKSKLFRPN
ncbi:hypothetical protein SDC9_201668 [bioreactor metagenome]|uniref:Uncharacterized protein n=1 Tax=bioreactor metagenome TaxID=1076179 RepID=A0A645IUB3_9ZZZZ